MGPMPSVPPGPQSQPGSPDETFPDASLWVAPKSLRPNVKAVAIAARHPSSKMNNEKRSDGPLWLLNKFSPPKPGEYDSSAQFPIPRYEPVTIPTLDELASRLLS